MAALRGRGGQEEVMGELRGTRANERTQSDYIVLGSIFEQTASNLIDTT